jgi:nucleoside-diphosphate-sugar epimerase
VQAIPHFLVFGLGYTGRAIAAAAAAQGWHVAATSRDPATAPPDGVSLQPFDRADLAGVTHIVATAPPSADADPVLTTHGAALAASQTLRWVGYLSTTGVYGDRGGAWVDEDTPPHPTGPRGALRVAIEQAWVATLAKSCAVDLFRVAGIYGPGRSPLDDLRAGRARRIVKPGHAFGRIHRDDIARAVLAAAAQARPPGARVLHLNDDQPAEPAQVIEAAAALLGLPVPPAIDYADAAATMSAMGRSFWAENRKVACLKTKAALDIAWRYPTYHEGLAAILATEQPPSSAPVGSER